VARAGAENGHIRHATEGVSRIFDQNRSHRSYVEPALSVWEAGLDTRALLATIKPSQIEHVKLRRTQQVARSTVDKDLAVLKAFFNCCVARNLAASNPARRVKFFNDDNFRLRYLTEDEYTRLVQAAKAIERSPFLAEKIILSVHTGLRRGSLVIFNGIRWTSRLRPNASWPGCSRDGARRGRFGWPRPV